MKMIKTLGLTLAAAGLMTITAHAIPSYINGTIQFVGTGSLTVGGGITTFTPNNPWDSTIATGDYASVPIGTDVTKSAISYTGSGVGAVLTAPVVPEWTFTIGMITYSFDLTSLTSALYTPGNPSALAMSGDGIAYITGFLPTYASWSLQATGNGFIFQAGAQSTTAIGGEVPDGGTTVILLGAALSSLAWVNSRRKL